MYFIRTSRRLCRLIKGSHLSYNIAGPHSRFRWLLMQISLAIGLTVRNSTKSDTVKYISLLITILVTLLHGNQLPKVPSNSNGSIPSHQPQTHSRAALFRDAIHGLKIHNITLRSMKYITRPSPYPRRDPEIPQPICLHAGCKELQYDDRRQRYCRDDLRQY